MVTIETGPNLTFLLLFLGIAAIGVFGMVRK